MARIKHWDHRYSVISENICSRPGCSRAAEEITDGRAVCARHMVLRISLTREPRLRPGQGIGR